MEDEELIPFMFNGKAVLSADIEWLHVKFKSAPDGGILSFSAGRNLGPRREMDICHYTIEKPNGRVMNVSTRIPSIDDAIRMNTKVYIYHVTQESLILQSLDVDGSELTIGLS